jgi:signal transduction histidine kinase
MPRVVKTHPSFGIAPINLLLTGAVFFGAMTSGALVHGQAASVITNLAQLTQALERESQIISDISLDAVVFACDTDSGALILEDASGAELLEIDSLEHEFKPGDKIHIEFSRCFAHPGDVGIYVSAAPVLENDGLHSPRTYSCDYALTAGRYPLRVDWFNQFSFSYLEVSCAATNLAEQTVGNEPATITNLFHVARAECYEGNWLRLPNFQLFRPAKAGKITDFDIAFRTRDEMAGIRFTGYFDAPQSGTYHFSLRSDDGSRLWIGEPGVPIRKLGTNSPPPAPLAAPGEPMSSLAERRLATLEGRVSFVSRSGKGLRFEMRSEPNSISVAIADAASLEPQDLLGAYVRVSGVAAGVLNADQRVVLGRLAAASSKELAIIENAPGKGEPAPVLTTVLQVHSLSTNDAARQLPVKIRGVVTAVASGPGHWIAIQDDTRGGFVRIGSVSNCVPNVGEFWEITGRTQPGDFAPIIMARQLVLLGRGRLPEPAHPTWNQLLNGSMDVQWAELQGLVTGVHSNGVSLLLPEGRQEVRLEGWGESELRQFDKAVVRIRGALFAVWNSVTHEVRIGNIEVRNASVTVDRPAPGDPFDAPEKTPRGLFLFDAKATPFQRVKVRGQVTYADSRRVFIEHGAGIQVLPAGGLTLNLGDVVEAVGYPELSGAAPVLREALLRKTGNGALPPPPLISDSELVPERLASKRIRIEGNLVGHHLEEGTLVLQMQAHKYLFLARVAKADSLDSLRPGSRLSLIGIYASDAPTGMSSGDASRFEVLLNAPGDVTVISEPSWWTLQRLLSAVGVLLVTLTLAAIWITLLRRQVAQRTLQLQREIRERERAERQHALEAERSRIARDLHDDLGSSLTEINVLASTGQRPRPAAEASPALFKAIAEKARSLIAALDVIVWAVDPEDNSLQSLADYLSGYTLEYLSSSAIASRFKIPVSLPNATLDGEIRHELLMVVKETLHNIVRHASATEVEFQLNVANDALEICIVDNGKGFNPNSEVAGHGLKNRLTRLTKIGGSCQIESRAGIGTTVRIRLPLPLSVAERRAEANTTFD